MTILGLHVDVKISAKVDLKIEANLFGENKQEAIRTVELYKQLTPSHNQHLDYYYTSEMLKDSISTFFSDLFQKIKGFLWK